MPTYDYHCKTCGTFEYVQNIKDDPLAKCPTCGQEVKRLISKNVGIIFKGSGFYVNDSRKPSSTETCTEKASCCSDGNCALKPPVDHAS